MNIDVKIKSDEFDLIASGSLITFSGKRTSFNIINDESPLTVVFEFIKNETDKESKKEISVQEKSLIIKFFNYTQNRFTTEPWKIGTLYKRDLYILYYIEPLHNTEIRNITYSFYLGKEETNG